MPFSQPKPPELQAFTDAAKALYEAFLREGDSPERASVRLRKAVTIAGDFQAVNHGGRTHYGQPCDGDECGVCAAMTKRVARG